MIGPISQIRSGLSVVSAGLLSSAIVLLTTASASATPLSSVSIAMPMELEVDEPVQRHDKGRMQRHGRARPVLDDAAAANATAQKTQVQRQLDAATRAARARSSAMRAKITPSQARSLRSIGQQFAQNPTSTQAMRQWQAFLSATRPAANDVPALAQLVLYETYRQLAEDWEREIGDNAQLLQFDLQKATQKQQHQMQLMSKLIKNMHAASKSIIQNMK